MNPLEKCGILTWKAPDGKPKLWDARIPQLVDIGRASRYLQVGR